MVDQVKVAAVEQEPTEQSLRRNLTNRHIQLIAIGGAIGTGLFMGSGKTISLAGPSIIFVYMIIGFMLFFVMRAMGELLLSNLEYKSFSDFAADLLGPWAGYFTGSTSQSTVCSARRYSAKPGMTIIARRGLRPWTRVKIDSVSPLPARICAAGN